MLEVAQPGLERPGREEQDHFHAAQMQTLLEAGEEHGILAEAVAVKHKGAQA